MFRSPWHPVALGAGMAALLAGCGGSPPASAPPSAQLSASSSSPSHSAAPASGKPLQKVKLGLAVNLLAFTPIHVAQANGYFKQNRLDVQVVSLSGGTTSAETLYSGSIQFAASAASDVIHGDQKGLGLLAVANILNANDVELVISKKIAEQDHLTVNTPLKSRLQPLEGKLFGVTSAGSISQIYTQMLFQSVGLDPKGLHFIAIGSAPALNAALKGGRIAGYLLGPPAGELAEKGGYGTVIVPIKGAPVFGKQAFTDIFTTHKYAKSHPAVVKAMATAIAEADHYIVTHPDGAAQVAHHYFKVPVPLLTSGLKSLPFVSDGRFTEPGWQSAEKILNQAGLIQGTLPSTKEGVMWTNQFLPSP